MMLLFLNNKSRVEFTLLFTTFDASTLIHHHNRIAPSGINSCLATKIHMAYASREFLELGNMESSKNNFMACLT